MRIIGGEFKSRKLDFKCSPSVRPMTDRMKETLFNILGETVRGARGFLPSSRGQHVRVLAERDLARTEATPPGRRDGARPDLTGLPDPSRGWRAEPGQKQSRAASQLGRRHPGVC